MLNTKEKTVLIYALEECAKELEAEGSFKARNEMLELIWKVSASMKETYVE